MIIELFLYRPADWCFFRGMKYLSILMVGVALLVGGGGEKEVADEKPAEEQTSVKAPVREVSVDELEKRDGVQYVKGENTPFTGTAIHYREDGSKGQERTYENGELISSKEWDEDGNLIKDE